MLAMFHIKYEYKPSIELYRYNVFITLILLVFLVYDNRAMDYDQMLSASYLPRVSEVCLSNKYW